MAPIYKVDEIFTSILDDRKTDNFGRYKWLLSSDDNSKHISFMHWDYEPLLSQDFNISSSSITNLDIQLVPKMQYQTQFNLSGPSEALLVLTNSVGLIDSIALSSTFEPISGLCHYSSWIRLVFLCRFMSSIRCLAC